MSVGPWPAEARARASRVAARTASTSFPSTCTPGIPYPWPRWAMEACDCTRTGSEMAHWLFWQKKTDRHDVAGGEAEGLCDVPLARGTVTEVGQGRRGGTVERDPEGVAGGVERLGADDDGRGGDAVHGRVPTGQPGAPPEPQHGHRVDAAAVGNPVLAVAREDEVVGTQGPGRPDLGGLLPEERGPQRELALPLQGHGLGIDAADHHHVAVEVA